MKHLVKTEIHHKDACTQFSIAMALDIPVEEVVNGMGTWRGVAPSGIGNYLTRKGYWNGSINQAGEGINIEGKGIAIIQSEAEGHCVAFEDGIVYDPNGRIFSGDCAVENLCAYYTRYEEDKLVWSARVVMELEPVKVREWSVGKKEEVTA